MKVFDAHICEAFLKVRLAKFGSIHANWIVPNIQHTLDSRRLKARKNFVNRAAFVSERKEISLRRRPRFIPEELAFRARARGFGRQLKGAHGQKVIPSIPKGLCRPFLAVELILYPVPFDAPIDYSG